MVETNTRKLFERQIEIIRAKLRVISPELMRELEAAELALNTLGPDRNANEYAGFRRAIDAIQAYLKKVGHTATGSKIASSLIQGGWLSSDTRAIHNVVDSIRYHLKHPETGKLRLFAGSAEDPRNAEVGLQEWTEEYRAPEGR